MDMNWWEQHYIYIVHWVLLIRLVKNRLRVLNIFTDRAMYPHNRTVIANFSSVVWRSPEGVKLLVTTVSIFLIEDKKLKARRLIQEMEEFNFCTGKSNYNSKRTIRNQTYYYIYTIRSTKDNLQFWLTLLL